MPGLVKRGAHDTYQAVGRVTDEGGAPQPVRAMLEVVPYGHTVQCKEPGADENDPGSQRTQRNLPGRDLAQPGLQRRSAAAPLWFTRSTPALGTAQWPCLEWPRACMPLHAHTIPRVHWRCSWSEHARYKYVYQKICHLKE